MLKTALKLTAAISLLTAASITNAARNPSVEYASELDKVKLQYPTSGDELCESDSSYPECIGYKKSNVWWMYDSNNNVVHKINGNDPQRNELRNKKEFNMKTTSKSFEGTFEKIGVSSLNHVTILQLHNSTSNSKPLMRIQYDRSNDRYEVEVAESQFAPTDYCKEVYSTSGSGSKYFKIYQKTENGKRYLKMKIGTQTHKCDVSNWPSQTKYYYKMGTYLSDGNGSAEFKFKNWNWNQ